MLKNLSVTCPVWFGEKRQWRRQTGAQENKKDKILLATTYAYSKNIITPNDLEFNSV